MNKFLSSKNKSLCCGCGTCAKMCPHGAITMIKDIDGFFYPQVNNSLCVDCEVCTKICQYSESIDNCKNELNKIICIGAVLKDNELRKQSSSGGAFYAFASGILEQGGIVYGAAWNKDLSVSQTRISDVKDISLLQGSKYVVSNVNDSYFNVKNDLINNKVVLYTGTPCQISGLYAFLQKSYSNLYTCDIICHGTPSQKYFDTYIDECLKKRYKKEDVKIKFKDKTTDWRNPGFLIFLNGETIYNKPLYQTEYWKLYHTRYTVMDACNSCKYASLPRRSDVTIGDFWNYQNDKYNLGESQNGVSSILLNNENGQKLFSFCEKFLNYKIVGIEDVMQLHLKESAKPVSINKKGEFRRIVKTKGFIKSAYLIDKEKNGIVQKIILKLKTKFRGN